MTDPTTTVGQRLRVAREAAGMTQADVARLVGTSVPAISMIESGRRDPRLSTLMRLLDALGLAIGPAPPERAVLTLDEVVRRAAEGRRHLGRAGMGPSDPALRLRAKRDAGHDVSVEERLLAGT